MVAKTRTFPQLSDVDLKLLRVFDSIVRNDGFSAAQYDLNMSLPNISSSMTQLEFRLGFKLCERGRSGFHLTEGGIDVYEALEALFSSIDTFQESVHRFKGDMHGRVAISVDDAIVTNSRCPLHRIIKCYVESAPNLDLNLLIVSPPEMEKALLENQLNIAIGPFRGISDALEATPIYEETQLLCCGKGHASYGLLDQKKIDEIINAIGRKINGVYAFELFLYGTPKLLIGKIILYFRIDGVSISLNIFILQFNAISQNY